MIPNAYRHQRGVSLLEVALSLAVIAVLTFSFGFAVPATMEENRSNQAKEQIQRVKRALIGEPLRVRRGQRNVNRFGYFGDMGNFPAALADLVEIDTQAGYAVTAIIQLGSGWRGPYIATDPFDFLEDPWGNALEFDTSETTSASTGSTVIATIRSIGPDSTSGTSDDEVIEIYEGEASSDLFGYIRGPSGRTIPGVDVTISYPSAGAITTDTMTTDADGFYTFGVIPHGERVIELDPTLSFQADTAFSDGNALDDIEFFIENIGENDTTVTSFTLTYSSSPQAYFEQVTIDGSQVFNSTTPRGASGDVITFTSELVTGTGVTQAPTHIVVSSMFFQVPEITISSVGTGGTLEIHIDGFSDAATGGGAPPVDMTGVTFEIEFSDGSTTLFTAKQMP